MSKTIELRTPTEITAANQAMVNDYAAGISAVRAATERIAVPLPPRNAQLRAKIGQLLTEPTQYERPEVFSAVVRGTIEDIVSPGQIVVKWYGGLDDPSDSKRPDRQVVYEGHYSVTDRGQRVLNELYFDPQVPQAELEAVYEQLQQNPQN